MRFLSIQLGYPFLKKGRKALAQVASFRHLTHILWQQVRETTEQYIMRFKKAKVRCQVNILLESEFGSSYGPLSLSWARAVGGEARRNPSGQLKWNWIIRSGLLLFRAMSKATLQSWEDDAKGMWDPLGVIKSTPIPFPYWFIAPSKYIFHAPVQYPKYPHLGNSLYHSLLLWVLSTKIWYDTPFDCFSCHLL